MASNYGYAFDESGSDFTDTDTDVSDSNSEQSELQQACKYYNKGHCRDGEMCKYLHVCKYYLKGNCRHGNRCHLSHIKNCDSGIDNSRPYRWQLNLGSGWKDIANDFILEAQFSRPNTKGIKIYNTPSGVLTIDFIKMRVLKKNFQVRRQGSRDSNWLWYYRGNDGWYEFGKKDAEGSVSPVNSSTLESEFQKNPCGTVPFTINSTNYEIHFKDMYQKNLTTDHRRRIRRRPKYVSLQDEGVNSATNMLNSMWPSSSRKPPLWQFSGRAGNWHNYKAQSGCSVSSADIEAEFQRNPKGSMDFSVNGYQYKLNFSQMRQTSQTTGATRAIRRLKQ